MIDTVGFGRLILIFFAAVASAMAQEVAGPSAVGSGRDGSGRRRLHLHGNQLKVSPQSVMMKAFKSESVRVRRAVGLFQVSRHVVKCAVMASGGTFDR